MQGSGTDFLCVLYSKEVLNIEAIRQQLEQASGKLVEKVKRVLGDKLVAGQNLKYSPSEIGFTAVSHNKQVVALIVELEHK